VQYIKSDLKVEIICPNHGSFWQRPNDHQRRDGCPSCKFTNLADSKRKSIDQFIVESNTQHDFKYNYLKSFYKNAFKKVEIICPNHGSFWQSPGIHSTGCGCPKCACNVSRAEQKIIKYLTTKNIKFVFNKTFDDLRNPATKAKLRVDFWLPHFNIIIEYDGQQHYIPANVKGRVGNSYTQQQNYKKIVLSDILKTEYAERCEIKLLRIPYYYSTQKEIDAILDDLLASEI